MRRTRDKGGWVRRNFEPRLFGLFLTTTCMSFGHQRLLRLRALFLEWLNSRSFTTEYAKFLLTVPRRLTKKELLRLRDVSVMQTLDVSSIKVPSLSIWFCCF